MRAVPAIRVRAPTREPDDRTATSVRIELAQDEPRCFALFVEPGDAIEEGVLGLAIVRDALVVRDIVRKTFDVRGAELGEETPRGDVVDDVDDEHPRPRARARWRTSIVKGVGVRGVTRVGWLSIHKVLNEEKATTALLPLRLRRQS